jgi:hypothetical protein
MNYLKIYEEFIDKREIMDWLYSNEILNKNEELNLPNIKNILNHLLKTNQDLIKKTALKNCHAVGLNSFILNSYPKIRLFTTDDDCEIRKFDWMNPIIPIHPHKYDDLFFQLSGKLIHHLYEKKDNGIKFNKYNFIRLNNINTEIVKLGEENLKYIGQFSNINRLRSKTLHTASVQDECSWIIIETKKDETFSEIFYHQNLQKRDDLYKPFDSPIEYLQNYINSI